MVKKIDGSKQGISRSVFNNSVIYEWSWKDNKLHGLYLEWNNEGQLFAGIYQNGVCKGYMSWNKHWHEEKCDNKKYC